MDRGQPCGSKICARRMEQRRLEMHRARVRSVRPLVDTSEPQATQMEHVRMNLKKEQMLEERYSEIDRENRILLKKMSDIMKQPGSPQSARQIGPQSLNRDARKKELLRITKDNQSILKRIQQAQPVYNHVEWEGVDRRNMSYLKNCAEFPLVLRSARGRPSELVPIAAGGPGAEEQRPQSARTAHKTAGRLEDPLSPRGLEYVLKESMTISGKFYIVEIATDGRELHVTAYDGESKELLELVVKERVHRRLYRETNGDYGSVARRLAVEGGRLVLQEDTSPSSSSYVAKAEGRAASPEGLDAEAMMLHSSAKTGTPGHVSAQVDLSGSGEHQVRVRGLTPSTAQSVIVQSVPSTAR